MRTWLLFLLIACLFVGCSSTDMDDDEELTTEESLRGNWVRVVDLTELRLTINEDGTYDVSFGALDFEGTYQFDINGLLIVQDSGCGNFAGVYSINFTEEARSLILGLVEDNCRARQERWHGIWTRVGAGG